jgi:hypothetical protein
MFLDSFLMMNDILPVLFLFENVFEQRGVQFASNAT